MAAARYSSEVLQMFYGPIAEQENAGLSQPLEPDVVEIDDIFILVRRNIFFRSGCVYGKWSYPAET